MLPEHVWLLCVVIIGGSLPWVGIYLQLRHDSIEREKERKMSLRRDIYLLLMGNIGQQLSSLASFYWQDFPSIEGYAETISQIDIIGNRETIQATYEFNNQLNTAFFELPSEKEELTLLKQNINAETDLYEKDLLGDDVGEWIEKYNKLWKKYITQVENLAEKCHEQCKLCQKLLVPVIAAMRKELDIQFDEAAYQAMMKKSHNKWKEDLHKYLASMRSIQETVIQGLSL